MRFHCLQHVPFETPGSIGTWIEDKGYSLGYTRFYDSEPLPKQDEFDALVIMGGPMSIHDENIHTWLIPEKTFIQSAIDHQKKIIAICLGAQLVAEVTGSAVYENPDKEIGFFPVQFTEAAQRSRLLTGLPASATFFHCMVKRSTCRPKPFIWRILRHAPTRAFYYTIMYSVCSFTQSLHPGSCAI